MMIYSQQLPHFQTRTFPLEQQAAHFSSPYVHCIGTCLAWMGRTVQSPGVLSCHGVSFGRSFPLSRPRSCRWVTASVEKEFRSCTASKHRHLLSTKVKLKKNTSLVEMALAPSEPGDKLSMDEEVVSLLWKINRLIGWDSESVDVIECQ